MSIYKYAKICINMLTLFFYCGMLKVSMKIEILEKE